MPFLMQTLKNLSPPQTLYITLPFANHRTLYVGFSFNLSPYLYQLRDFLFFFFFFLKYLGSVKLMMGPVLICITCEWLWVSAVYRMTKHAAIWFCSAAQLCWGSPSWACFRGRITVSQVCTFFFLLSGVSGNAPHHASGNEGQSVAWGPDPISAERPDRFFCSPI